jgi:hypothetical protein
MSVPLTGVADFVAPFASGEEWLRVIGAGRDGTRSGQWLCGSPGSSIHGSNRRTDPLTRQAGQTGTMSRYVTPVRSGQRDRTRHTPKGVSCRAEESFRSDTRRGGRRAGQDRAKPSNESVGNAELGKGLATYRARSSGLRPLWWSGSTWNGPPVSHLGHGGRHILVGRSSPAYRMATATC